MTVPHATPAGAGLRLIRAAVFTAVCVVLSAAGHALASCATVPWWALVIAFLAVFAVAAPLAGQRRSLPGIAAGLAFGQLGLHAVFGLAQHGDAAPQAPSRHGHLARGARRPAGLRGQLRPAQPGRRPADPGDRRTGPGHHDGPGRRAGRGAGTCRLHAHMVQAYAAPATGLFSTGMLVGHLLAALAAGWLLGRGDAALFRLVELSRASAEADPVRPLRAALAFVRTLRAGLPGAPAGTRQATRSAAEPAAHTGREALQHTVIRRGPPCTALALAA